MFRKDAGVKPVGGIRFTYSSPDLPRFKRAVIRSIELLGGQRRIKRLYFRTVSSMGPNETFFASALRHLAVDVAFDQAALDKTPRDGPVIFIANHPYGVLDGLVLAHLCTLVRPEAKVLANSVLCSIPEARDNLLPVDFARTKDALNTTLQSRIDAQKWLDDGHSIGIFPGGGVSTAARPLRGPALDLPWAPFLAKLVRQSQATVVPIYFSGQNSRAFHIASHMSSTLRLSLMFRETARRIGTRVDVRIGEPIPFAALKDLPDRSDILAVLRAEVFKMAPDVGTDWMAPGRLKAS